MIGEIGSILQSSRIDLVVLNDVSAALRFEIIKEGQLLYCADESERVDFETFATYIVEFPNTNSTSVE